MPLEWRVGLGREITDREVELQPAEIGALPLQGLAGIGDAEHVGVSFTRQTDHEIELQLSIAVLHRRTNAGQQLCVGEPLIDDVAQTLAASLRRKGEARLAGTAQDVGDVLIKTIHSLARQGEADVFVSQAIAQLHPHRRQSQIIRAAQRKQREIAVAGAAHALLNGFDDRFWLHIAGRASQHPRLTEAATAGAAAANFHREPVVHGFDMGHQPHGVVGHRRGRSPLNPSRNAWFERLDTHPIDAGAI